jgi:hypothetical protein
LPEDGGQRLFADGDPALRHGSGRSSLEKPNCWLFARFADRSSRLFTRPLGMPFVNVRPTMLDDSSWFRPFMETYASTKMPFAETGAVRSFATFPGMGEIEGLLGEYAGWAE